MTSPGLDISRRGALLWLQLDRPERLNAIDTGIAADLVDALAGAASTVDVRAVVLTGSGGVFSAGADLKSTRVGRGEARREPMAGVPTTGGQVPFLDLCNEAVLRILELRVPVVAAINGRTVGIAGSLAMAADVVLVAESARISLGFSKLGLMPDGGATALLPARVGLRTAQAMAFLGEELSAERAVETGWAHRILPDDGFEQQVLEIAQDLAAGPTKAFRQTKAALNEHLVDRVRTALTLESEGQLELTTTSDHVEAIRAFRERRAPRFSGT